MIDQKYKKAFTEVYEILTFLEKEELNKIPKKFIDVIKSNRDTEYKYIVKDTLDKQPMASETKAILFNVFRDYLATSEQKAKIIAIQRKEREMLEEEKRKQYGTDIIFRNTKRKMCY